MENQMKFSDIVKPTVSTAAFEDVVFTRIVSDLSALSERLEQNETAKELTAWLDGDRLRHSDLSVMAIFAAELSSNVAFLRPGEPWKLEVAGERSQRGALIVAALHRLRGACIARADVLYSGAWSKALPRNLARSLLILALSLDAVPDRLVRAFCAGADMDLTGDPQGDAQLLAEELADETDEKGGASGPAAHLTHRRPARENPGDPLENWQPSKDKQVFRLVE